MEWLATSTHASSRIIPGLGKSGADDYEELRYEDRWLSSSEYEQSLEDIVRGGACAGSVSELGSVICIAFDFDGGGPKSELFLLLADPRFRLLSSLLAEFHQLARPRNRSLLKIDYLVNLSLLKVVINS